MFKAVTVVYHLQLVSIGFLFKTVPDNLLRTPTGSHVTKQWW